MSDEILFRIALLVIIGLLSSITLTFRRRAKTPKEKVSHAVEGWVRYIALQSSAVVLFVSNLAYLLFPPAIAWASLPIPDVLAMVRLLDCDPFVPSDDLDIVSPRKEPHGHGRDQVGRILGNKRPIPLGSASLLLN